MRGRPPDNRIRRGTRWPGPRFRWCQSVADLTERSHDADTAELSAPGFSGHGVRRRYAQDGLAAPRGTGGNLHRPEDENLRALIDTLEPQLGFRNRLDGRHPELGGGRRLEGRGG